MNDRWRRTSLGPILVSGIALFGLFLALLRLLLRATGGRLVYVLDDPYIHLAMARNLAHHGVWGLHSGQFSNTSSSPLWTLLLAIVDRIAGTHQATPLLLNLLAAVLLLAVAGRALTGAARGPGGRGGAGAAAVTLILLALLFWTPLAPLIFTGQEHILHALLSLLFVLALVRTLPPPDEAGIGHEARYRDRRRLYLLGALLPLLRYEGLFLCLAGALFLFLRRRRRTAFLLLAYAMVPAGIFGLICVLYGWYPLPNPVLLKGNLPALCSCTDLLNFARAGYRQALSAPHLLFLLLAGLTIFALRWRSARGAQDPWTAALGTFNLTALFHLQLARLRWFYRYEAYLIFLGLLLLAVLGLRWHRTREGAPLRSGPDGGTGSRVVGVITLLVLSFFPVAALSDRALEAAAKVPQAAGNIWEQQMQMGLFLKRFYPGAKIAANDLGAISFLADTDALDLWGLASMDVARSRLGGGYDQDEIERLAQRQGCRIAILYESWFAPGGFGGIRAGRKGGIPTSWFRAGTWTIGENFVGGDSTVSIYAIQPAEKDSLLARLRAFAPSLPRRVKQAGPYLETLKPLD